MRHGGKVCAGRVQAYRQRVVCIYFIFHLSSTDLQGMKKSVPSIEDTPCIGISD